MKQAALDYINHGFYIIPLYYPTPGGSCSCGRADCHSIGKHPMTPNGVKDAFNDPALVSFWWDKHPDANIGIATGNGLVVLDTDGADGRESLSTLLSEFGFTELPETWTALTGGGGVHYLFRCSDPSIRNRAGIRPNIDVRAKGGYIVAPPSLHRSGERYQWESFHSPSDIPIAELPDWLHVLLSQSAAPQKKALPPGERVPEGNRNDYLFRLASSLRGQQGLTEAAIIAAVLEENKVRCDPPLSEKEVETLCKSAGRYAPGDDLSQKRQAPRPALVKASEIPYEPPRWLISPYFQRGKGTLIQGDNGTGKTAFMCAIAAHVTTGQPLLTIPIETPGDVLILSVEDDLPILRGRIEADGGDLDKCHFLTNAAGLTFNSPEVESAIKEIKAKLVIFDPFQAFLGAGVDMFRANEVRPELAKLFEMCERSDCACAIIAHMGKSGGDKSPVNRSLGSVDIPAAMRSIMQLVRNPDNEDECIMVHVKCSNAPKGRSLAYSIGDRGGVTWHGFSDMTPEDLSVIAKRKEKGVPYENEPLVQVFNQLITDKPGGGFWSYADLKSEGAKILGFPPYSDSRDLTRRLDGGLAKELQERDGLIVTCGARTNKARGIRIEQYQQPQSYQAKMQ